MAIYPEKVILGSSYENQNVGDTAKRWRLAIGGKPLPLPLDVVHVFDDFICPEPLFFEVFRSLPEFTHLKLVRSWIQYAPKHKTRILHLRVPFFTVRCGYPYTSLEELYLHDLCKLGSGIINFPRLRKLTVYQATLSSDDIKNLLSGSPVLEYLSLDDCPSTCVINHACLKHLAIVNVRESSITNCQLFVSAPNLLSFFYDGELSFLNLYKTNLNMPSVISAYLMVRDSSTIKCLNGMAAILPFFATVEFLELRVQCNWHKLTYAESGASTRESLDVSSRGAESVDLI